MPALTSVRKKIMVFLILGFSIRIRKSIVINPEPGMHWGKLTERGSGGEFMETVMRLRIFALVSVFLLLTVGLSLPGVTSAADTGWVSPTTSNAYGPYINDNGAYDDGGGYATFAIGSQMEYSGYNFSIPDGSTITAITVRLDAWNNFPECSTKYVLGIHNGSNWSLPPDPEVTPTNVEATYEVGNNLWGLAWTAAAINTNFKVGF
jgi:hypothetical protein